MRFDVLTIFPGLLQSPLEEGIVRRAIQDRKIEVVLHNIRDFAADRHAMTDDRPFGGGEGMVMKPEPIVEALEHLGCAEGSRRVILLSPQGRPFHQELARELASWDNLVLICGRYEGVDDRVRANFVDEEISIGDYILSGGELAALILIDAITRLIPGVLGCPESASRETFSSGLLKYPQFTRPRVFRQWPVPEVLLSGNHAAISEWRFIASVRRTLRNRPDLLDRRQFSAEEKRWLRRNGLLQG